MKSLLRLLPGLAFLIAPVLPPATAQAPTPSPYNDGVAHKDKAPVPPSHSIKITYAGHITTLTLDDLLKMPQTTVHVHNAHSNEDETYAGPLLADVLARAGLVSNKETEPIILHSTVIATATDRYFALYSAAEVEPAFSRSQVIVAVMKSDLPDSTGGLIQLIDTDDAKPARWVHGLLDINVLTLAAKFNPPAPAPTPAGVPK